MKGKHIIGILLCLGALASVTICIFSDWNDRLFLPLALLLSGVGTLWNVLSLRKQGKGKEQ